MKDFIIPDRDFGTPAAKSKQMVTLTIDGFDITVPEGTSIMRAAAEMVDAIGYDALTMDQLAEHAGITKPTLYAYFPNKEALTVASIVDKMAQVQEWLDAQAQDESADVRLRNLLQHILATRFIDGERPLVGALTRQILEHPDYIAAHGHILNTFMGIVRCGQASGVFRPNADPELYARTCISIFRDREYDCLASRSPEAAETLVEQLTTYMMKMIESRLPECP